MKHRDSDPQPNPEDDRVGYGRPPRKNRFRKGQSGNPKGRPRGAHSIETLLEVELNRFITIKEGGRERQVSRRRALVLRLIERGMQGDPRILMALMHFEGRNRQATDETEAKPLSPTEEEILRFAIAHADRKKKRKR